MAAETDQYLVLEEGHMTEPQDAQPPLERSPTDASRTELANPRTPDMPFHPLAELFPLPSEDELRAMADDIAAHGLREPIVTLEGQILDGRCRYLACKMAAVEPQFENYAGDDPIAYVYSRNVARRHLTKPQCEILAARLADLRVGSNQHSAGLPIGRACQLLHVKERSVGRARKIVGRGIPELVQAVESGKVSLSAGEQISQLPPPEQQNALKYGGAGSAPALPDNRSMPSQSSRQRKATANSPPPTTSSTTRSSIVARGDAVAHRHALNAHAHSNGLR
jgi:hypothetical protein